MKKIVIKIIKPLIRKVARKPTKVIKSKKLYTRKQKNGKRHMV